MWTHREAVMGTGVAFAVHRAPAERAAAAVADAVAWLHHVDAVFSTYIPDSQICRLDRGELGLRECEPEVRWILDLCDRLEAETGGWFCARAAGRLDPSGVVKGWAVEEASRRLAAAGCGDHLVECGGDVRLRGRPESDGDWQVGIVHPLRLDAYCAALHLGEGAVATSGTYERGFHIVDPHTGRPATGLAAVTLVGPELTLTDAYATAALAMGPAAPGWLERLDGYDSLVIDDVGRGWQSAGFARHQVPLAPTG